MAKCGFLNAVKHTGNGLEQLKIWGGDNYINPEGYVNAQTVSDKNIVTANGSATLEFAKELLLQLKNDTPERIEMYYQFYKQGFFSIYRGERLINLMGIILCSNILSRFNADTVARLLHDFDNRWQGFVEVCQTIFATATEKLIILAEIEPLRNVKISWNNTTLPSWKSKGSIISRPVDELKVPRKIWTRREFRAFYSSPKRADIVLSFSR